MSIKNLAYDMITLLQEWHLWQAVSVCCNGVAYEDYSCNSSTYGFRDLTDVWSTPSSYDGADLGVKYYEFEPVIKPVMFIVCEGAPLSDIMGNTRYTMDVFKLPYHNDIMRIKEFKRGFYSIFEKYNVTCLPFGICFGWICYANTDLPEPLLKNIAAYQLADIESKRISY